MINFLIIGTILGLSAGFAPGPLLALVISETLQHDVKSGVKVALAPTLTDLPIIIITLFILAKLSNFHNILGIISLIGGLVILFMGYESIRTKGVELNLKETKPKSLTKGILVNALSPHPYLFWLTVGAPTVTKAMSQSIIAALAFICSFLALLVGSKIVLAIVVGKSKSFLAGNVYIYIMRFLGLALCVFAFVLFRDGLKLLGII
ncbi:MAG: LysE family transporter [Desulfobacterales bacterium]|nr:LysE family transporter [Deltaproteobacteria bacterium]NNK85862.1 LysE family transporter [Desulfobacterales bacterium]NNL77707.1 LysE family transporter [Desulfobacterales bacterium]